MTRAKGSKSHENEWYCHILTNQKLRIVEIEMSKKDKVNIIIFYTLWRSISPILKIFKHRLPLPKIKIKSQEKVYEK